MTWGNRRCEKERWAKTARMACEIGVFRPRTLRHPPSPRRGDTSRAPPRQRPARSGPRHVGGSTSAASPRRQPTRSGPRYATSEIHAIGALPRRRPTRSGPATPACAISPPLYASLRDRAPRRQPTRSGPTPTACATGPPRQRPLGQRIPSVPRPRNPEAARERAQAPGLAQTTPAP